MAKFNCDFCKKLFDSVKLRRYRSATIDPAICVFICVDCLNERSKQISGGK